LPASLEFAKAKVLLLRLTVPVDIFSSPILVEIDGVESHLRVKSTSEKPVATTTSRTDHDRIRKRPTSRGAMPTSYSKGSTQRRETGFSYANDFDTAIPTVEDLAQSFLQTEPTEERAELEAAILSETQEMGAASVLSEDEEVPMGTGAALSLPVFMAKFLQGIVDRLQLRIHGISINLDIDIPSEPSKLPSVQPTDPVTVQLMIEDIDIDGVTQKLATDSPSESDNAEVTHKEGKRLICLSNIRACLISEANFFSSLAHSSALSSPLTVHTPIFERKASSKAASSIRGSVLSGFEGAASPGDSSPLASSHISTTSSSKLASRSHVLDSSVVASDSGRFDDASEEDDTSTMSESAGLSEGGDSVFESSAYLDQVTQSKYSENDDESERGSGILSSSQIFPSSIRALSPHSTPRASIHIPPTDFALLAGASASGQEHPSQPMLQSTILPNQRHSRFSDSRISQSQPSLPLNLIPALQDHRTTQHDNMEILGNTNDNMQDSDGEDSDGSMPLGEDLAESRLFSHEDAESMYMSAISHTSSRSHVPGSWVGAGEKVSVDMRDSPKISTHEEALDNLEHARQVADVEPLSGSTNLSSSSSSVKSPTTPRSLLLSSSNIQQGTSAPFLPRGSSGASERSATSSDEYSKLSKPVFSLDSIKVYLPALNVDEPSEAPELNRKDSQYGFNNHGPSDTSRSTSINMPGAFSAYLPSQESTSLPPIPVPVHGKRNKETNDQVTDVEVVIGHLLAQFDISIARLVFKLVDQLKQIFRHDSTPNPTVSETKDAKLRVSVNEISTRFLERLEGTLGTKSADPLIKPSGEAAPADILLQASLKGLVVETVTSKSITKTALTLQKFSFGYAEENIVFFDSGLQIGASIRDLKADAGIDVSVNITQAAGTTRCEISTLPLHVSIDLQRLDETFSWFGGLSSVLNLGSSIASNTTVTAEIPSSVKASRGVRFEAPIRPDDRSVVSQNKADLRIGGFMLDLVGTECWVRARTSAVKLVSRDEGIGVTIQKIKLTGPHLRQRDEDPAISIDITNTRVEFHPAPKNSDLELLLSLITPSKAKYDQDDDIIFDTLLRQRKQGSVLRITIDDFQTSITKLHELSHLPELGEEVARLATVAKYLPDDERPGLLSLIVVNKFGATVDFNNAIGILQIRSTDINVAQITLPALIALSVGSVSARRNVSEELLGFAADPELREERSPSIMARMIGDEMDPIVKIKLCNIKAEYRVPTLMVLLGLAQDTTAQDLTTGLAASIATLTDFARLKQEPSQSIRAPASPNSKAMTVDIVLRDCVLGLNPLGLPSKMLVVLTEARSTIVLPKEGNSNATFDLNKASLLVIDNVAHLVAARPNSRIRRQSFDGVLVGDLCAMGYVSVSYISSASAIIQITTDEDQETSIDVELRDDLFVLESCADSTQTLVAILNGLSPPSPPPSKESKYRTKVIPVHDLLASLSGDAFGRAEGAYNIDDDFDLDDIVEGDSEDLDLDFDSQYYQNEAHHIDEEYRTAVSEDEGHSMASMHVTSRDTKDGVLLASFVEPIVAEESSGLDFHEDHFGTGSILEGTAHRWNSARNTYDRSNRHKVRKSPLKVCIRDVHIIWNLFDGYDWQHTRDTITKAVHDVESKAIERRARNERRSTFEQDIEDDETVIGDFLFNSIYIGIPTHRDPGDLSAAVNLDINDDATETESVATTTLSASPSRQTSSRWPRPKKLRLRRSKHHKIAFELRGVCVDFVAFPSGSGETQSSIDIRVRDFEIFDHIPTSTWRKFATYMQDAGERETGTSMIHIEILNVKPVPDLAAAEIVLKATVLPLRLHVDQDALDFITRFFEFKDESAPVQVSTGDPPFLQRVEVNAIQVKLDFKPKRVDYAGLRSGHTTEFMNFLILDEADMVLSRVIIYGTSGFERLGENLNNIWMPDIKRNQLPGILAGVAPVRSLVNVGGGLRQLITVPIREYKKDGRLMWGISKGAAAFAKTTGTELVKLGSKVAVGVQTVLQGAEDFLSPTSDVPEISADGEEVENENRQISRYANQPIGVVQGLKGGYAGLRRDLLLARDAVIAMPGEAMEGGSAAGVLRAVRKHAPTVILRPAIGVANASGQILMGATNSLDPKNLRRADEVSPGNICICMRFSFTDIWQKYKRH
jgi:autophagy-related protein 2